MRKLLGLIFVAVMLATPANAFAHKHVIETPNHEQQLANGQDHAPFATDTETGLVTGTSCGAGDPAGYGLETAHHGPDAGTPGKGEGCYMTTGNVPPGGDVSNPVITNPPK